MIIILITFHHVSCYVAKILDHVPYINNRSVVSDDGIENFVSVAFGLHIPAHILIVRKDSLK